MITEKSNLEHLRLTGQNINENEVYKLLEPSRNKDVSDVLSEMVWHVCRLYGMCKKPVFNPQSDAEIPDDATKEEVASQFISFQPLNADSYKTIGNFMSDVVIEEVWRDKDGTLLQSPLRRSKLVSEAFQQRAPIKTYVEKRLGITPPINETGSDWLVKMAQESAVFRHWWLGITQELMMRLERLPMETALVWQGIAASKAIQEQDQSTRQLSQKTQEEIANAKQEAGESLVSWVERQVGGDNRYYDATNQHHLDVTLECLANAFGKRRVAAALVNIPTYGTNEVKESLQKNYPFPNPDAG
ncbi:hypothetical protein ACTXK7_07070 [Vreelandella alkaliphila]|uniref:hypothetical protein n=1 Tax=Halomonadaceae TaxID=28256 RepID=UPI003F914C3B